MRDLPRRHNGTKGREVERERPSGDWEFFLVPPCLGVRTSENQGKISSHHQPSPAPDRGASRGELRSGGSLRPRCGLRSPPAMSSHASGMPTLRVPVAFTGPSTRHDRCPYLSATRDWGHRSPRSPRSFPMPWCRGVKKLHLKGSHKAQRHQEDAAPLAPPCPLIPAIPDPP